MKISEARTLYQVIAQLQQTPAARKVKFAYMLAHNKRLLEGVEQSFQAALSNEEENKILMAFEQSRQQKLVEAAVKNEAGEPVIENGQYKIENPQKVLPKLAAELEAEHPEAQRVIDERTKKIAELNDSDSEVELRKLPLSEWPDLPEGMSGMVMDVLSPLVADDVFESSTK